MWGKGKSSRRRRRSGQRGRLEKLARSVTSWRLRRRRRRRERTSICPVTCFVDRPTRGAAASAAFKTKETTKRKQREVAVSGSVTPPPLKTNPVY